jgi:hypothetical protein
MFDLCIDNHMLMDMLCVNKGGVVTHKSLYILFFIFFLFVTSCTESIIGPVTGLTPVPVAPEDSSIITQNPPAFVWQSLTAGGIFYLLQVSTDSQFTSGSIEIATMTYPPDTSYVPNDPLDPGEYYWRICAKEAC